MRRLFAICLVSIAILTGCPSTEKLHEQIEVLRQNNETLKQQFDDYVKSDARSSANVELAIQDISRAIEAISRYIQRSK